MHRASKSQKEKVAQFRGITGATERQGLQFLQAADWSMNVAIDTYFGGSTIPTPNSTRAVLEAAFKKYSDPQEGIINVEGVQRFCSDLHVDPMDITVLVFAWHCEAEVMCEFKHDEFVKGMMSLGVDSIDKLRSKVSYMQSELRDDNKFRSVYEYAFLFCREKGHKCVQKQVALEMWKLLFRQRRWPLASAWIDYVDEHHHRAISKDTWVQLFDFFQTIKPDLSNFEDNSAWPILIDEFVEHVRAARAKGDIMEVD